MRLLVTGAWREAGQYIGALIRMGHDIRFLQMEDDELPCDPDWPEGVIAGNLFTFHPLEQFTNLFYIQTTRTGNDHLPMEMIRRRRIFFHNAAGIYGIPMAETALSMILHIYRNGRNHYMNQTAHLWEKQRDQQELFGKTACIFGCGHVGIECARRLQAFGVRTVGINRSGRMKPFFNEIHANNEPVADECIYSADIVISAAPLTENTRHYFDRARLAAMKKNAVFINLSRGAVVCTEDLIDTLRMRSDLTAALDVFETEPLDVSSPLWDMENVIILPHDSFIGTGNGERLWNLIRRNLEEAETNISTVGGGNA